MKVTNNITLYMGTDAENTCKAEERDKHEKQSQKSLYVGNLNNELLENRLQQKKAEAQDRARKVIADAWAGDIAIDEDLQSRQEHIDALKTENKAVLSRIKEINQEIEKLKNAYGIVEEDEVQQIAGRDVTEYQQRRMELEDERSYCQDIVDDNVEMLKEEAAIISGTKRERLKHSPMTKAQRQADRILDVASKEIIGMVVEDAKENIDEEQKQREEKAEEIKAQKEEREEQESPLEDMPMEKILNLNHAKTDMQKEVEHMINEMKLVAEDIKGAMVDESL